MCRKSILNISPMQREFNETKTNDNTLELSEGQLTRPSGSTVQEKEGKDTFDLPSESSPTPKHRQKEIQEDSKKNDNAKEGEVQVYNDFEKMGLSDEVLRGIYAYGYEKPSAVQQKAIVPCVSGRDVVAQAQSGTGKTATFSISVLQQIDQSKKFCQVTIA